MTNEIKIEDCNPPRTSSGYCRNRDEFLTTYVEVGNKCYNRSQIYAVVGEDGDGNLLPITEEKLTLFSENSDHSNFFDLDM